MPPPLIHRLESKSPPLSIRDAIDLMCLMNNTAHPHLAYLQRTHADTLLAKPYSMKKNKDEL